MELIKFISFDEVLEAIDLFLRNYNPYTVSDCLFFSFFW